MNQFIQYCHRILNLPAERFIGNQGKDITLAVDNSEFMKVISLISDDEFTLTCLFAAECEEENSRMELYYAFERSGYASLLILKNRLSAEIAPSIALIFPTASLYEREIRDGFGIEFDNAKDTRRLFLHENYPTQFHPLRKSFRNGRMEYSDPVPSDDEYRFREVRGEGVYQIPVGPVHAGIIEPGHFRFSVIGETIYNLEIRMFWKHRGIEKLAEGKSPAQALTLAEAISGDETVANSWAFCIAAEQISNMEITPRADYQRLIFAEMERIYSLLGDLAGMPIDVAFPVGASPFFVLREEILRWNERLSGSRFYKGALTIGGVRKDVSKELMQELFLYLGAFSSRFHQAVQNILAQPSVIDRFEPTGALKKELIAPLNITGPMARASGVPLDVRIDHPYGLYTKLKPGMKVLDAGDVMSRFNVKADTIQDSVRLIGLATKEIPDGKISIEPKLKDGAVLSLVESCRGQNAQWVSIRHGLIDRYKVRTASFCNWVAIEFAVQNEIVPDFPLINKSMNLSYAGTDL